MSHVLVHLNPNEDYFDGEPTVQFGSYHIEQKLVEHFKVKEIQKLRRFIGSSSSILYYRGNLRGSLFESWADQILYRGGTFSIRCLRTSKVSSLTLPEYQKIVVPEFEQTYNYYYKPLDKDSIPCVDAWIPNVGFFQMTRTLTQPIKQRGLASLLGQTEMRNFYFVVPDDLFDNFKRQNFIFQKKESYKWEAKRRKVIEDIDEDIAMYVDQVNQFVLKISI